MYTIDASGCLSPVIQQKKETHCRQDLPSVYVLNGAVYVAECIFLKNKRSFLTTETKAYVMSKERSLDIDDDIDLKLCEILLGNA